MQVENWPQVTLWQAQLWETWLAKGLPLNNVPFQWMIGRFFSSVYLFVQVETPAVHTCIWRWGKKWSGNWNFQRAGAKHSGLTKQWNAFRPLLWSGAVYFARLAIESGDFPLPDYQASLQFMSNQGRGGDPHFCCNWFIDGGFDHGESNLHRIQWFFNSKISKNWPTFLSNTACPCGLTLVAQAKMPCPCLRASNRARFFPPPISARFPSRFFFLGIFP